MSGIGLSELKFEYTTSKKDINEIDNIINNFNENSVNLCVANRDKPSEIIKVS